jgi:hypothetical protein
LLAEGEVWVRFDTDGRVVEKTTFLKPEVVWQ